MGDRKNIEKFFIKEFKLNKETCNIMKARESMFNKLNNELGLSPKEAFYEAIRSTYEPSDIHKLMDSIYFNLLV